MDELDRRTRRMGTHLVDQISSLRSEVQHAIKVLRTDLADQAARKAENNVFSSGANVDVSALAQSLVRSEISGTNMAISLCLLDSLAFDRMDFRHSKIHEAHPRTFTNVFGNIIDPWLQSPELVFWISGKPGSGKSTLMKYIADNAKLRIKMRRWVGTQEPVIASYFFWINGTELQRSQDGLLRCLLYEILLQSPHMIEIAVPDSWRSITMMVFTGKPSQYSWKRAELLSAFQRLAQSGMTASRLIIFIDGLDEYGGDPDELIDTVQHLKTIKIKMCVASRPWNVFEEAFGQNRNCKLYLQELNKPDIEIYVNNKLRGRPEFQRLQIHASGADKIVDEIVEKSQGVFLWVFLVVRSLIEGLRNRDRPSQLLKRLRDFPSELTDFFGHIFQSMDPTYRAQAAHVFQVALHAYDTLSPLTYWYLDELEDDPEMALGMPLRPLEIRDLYDRIEDVKIRINGRYMGLLEMSVLEDTRPKPYVQLKVDFLHRTVTDFLKTTEIRRTFTSWQHEDFEPDLAICKASLAEIKSIITMDPQWAPDVADPIAAFFSSAKELEAKAQRTPTRYLDELERVGRGAQSLHSHVKLPWDYRSSYFNDFVSAAIKRNLLLFVRDRITALPPPVFRVAKMQYLLKPMSLEMACLILSIGPRIEIGKGIQDNLAEKLRSKGHDEVLAWMKEVCMYSSVQDDEFYPRLDCVLRERLSPPEIDGLIKLSVRYRRQGKREDGASKDGASGEAVSGKGVSREKVKLIGVEGKYSTRNWFGRLFH